jgi:hypothetical protein
LLTGLLLASVPVFLGLFAVPRLFGSSPEGPAAPVILDRLFAHEISRGRLEGADRELRHAPSGDGDSLAWRSEFEAVLAGNDPRKLEDARTTLVQALRVAPANPRAWTLLCEIDIHLHRDRAAACLDTAFYMGPFDWFVAERRTVLSAWLWPQLDRDTKDAAARRLRLMWQDTRLRRIALEAGLEPNGAALVIAAFANDAPALRDFERALAGQSRTSPLARTP